MENFDNLLPGNVLILGDQNKETEVYDKIKSKIESKFNILFDKKSNELISNIILRSSIDISLYDFGNYKFSKRIKVVRDENTLYNSTIINKYLVDNMGYSKVNDNLFVSEYYRKIVKIVYLYSLNDKHIQHISNNIEMYAQEKKYIFKSMKIESENKTKQCFERIKNEIKDCNTLMILYNYSFITDHSRSIDSFISLNLGFEENKNTTMLIDNIYGKWFDNFIIFNNSYTFELLSELDYVLKLEKLGEFELSKYFKNHELIKVNKYIPIFNCNGNDSRFIASYNSSNNKEDLEDNLNFYINRYKFQSKEPLFSSIYLKEYVYKIDNNEFIHRMKFGFRGKLEISKTKHTYKELGNNIYQLNIDNAVYNIFMSNNFESFKGIEIGKENPSKIEGVLIII